MSVEDLVKLVREGKLSVENVFKLVEDGRRGEAEALMKVLMDRAKNEPDEAIGNADGSVVFKRRGGRVVRDKNGNWELENKSKGREKEGPP